MMPVMMKPEPREHLLPQPVPQPPPQTTASVPVAAPFQQATSQESPQPQTSDKGEDGLPVDIESRIDVESIKGVFGWATVDGVNIPYIIRKYKKFVSVRIVEKKLLSRYPNAFPDELAKKDPLVSFFVTEYEAKLLDEINTRHCSFEYGAQSFTTKELIVDLVEFEDFYNLVKKTFPDDVLAKLRTNDQSSDSKEVSETGIPREILEKLCSWIQINNTVTPVIKRGECTFVPLSVIKYAAGLLTNTNLDGVPPTQDDCALLNETCKIAGFDFQFGKSTQLIELSEIVRRCQPTILQLPFEDPLKHARYLDTPSPSTQQSPTQQPPTSPILTPHTSPPGQNITNPQIPHHQFPYQRPNAPANPFHMMHMMARSLNPHQQLAYSQPGVMPNAMANQALMQRMHYNPLTGGKPSHPSQHPPQQLGQIPPQIHPGKPPPYSSGYNQNVSQSNVRMNFTPEQMHNMQKGQPTSQLQQFPRHTMSERFSPNHGYPYTGQSQRSLPPTPPYQNSMSSGRTGITSGAGKNVAPSSPSSSGRGPSPASASHPSRSPMEGSSTNPPAQTLISSSNSSTSVNKHLKIEGVVLNGKSISCLNLNSPERTGRFCLVEAVCKLYFNTLNINEFLFVLENVLKAPLFSCNDEEEKAFIHYYNLPVNVLKCNKMVHLSDLDDIFPRMTYIINKRERESSSHKSTNRQSSGIQDDGQPSNQIECALISRKRPSSSQGGPQTKQSYLEKTVQRLAQKNQSPGENSSQGTS